MKFSYKKPLYLGLAAVTLAGIGTSVNSHQVSAHQRTRVVKISHLSKWRRTKINRLKLTKHRNARQIRLMHKYLKHHKRTRRAKKARRKLAELVKRNRANHRQIQKLMLSRTVAKRNVRHRRVNKGVVKTNHVQPRKAISYAQLQQEMRPVHPSVNGVNNALQRIIKSHVNVNVGGKKIPLNNNAAMLKVAHLHGREVGNLMRQQIELQDQANQALNNNVTAPSVAAQMDSALDGQHHSVSEYYNSNNPFNGLGEAQIRQAYQQKDHALEQQINSLS